MAEASDGGFVGMAGLFWQEDRFHVWGMWVTPEVRGQGVGRELLANLLAWAGDVAPSAEVVLGVHPGHVAAVRLYRRCGLVATGRVDPLGHADGEVVHEMRWTRTSPP